MGLTSTYFQLLITSAFSLKLCKIEKEITRIYVFAAVFDLTPGLRVGAAPGKVGYFYSHLSLETVFPARKLAQNCYININISFS